MSGALVSAFGLTFVGGPLLFAALLKAKSRPPIIALLASVIIVLMLLAMQQLAQFQQHSADLGAFRPLVFLWLAWIVAIAMMVIALRPRMPTDWAQRRLFLIGLLSTTVPWFGLTAAQMVVN